MSEHFITEGKQFNRVRPQAKWWLSDVNGRYYVSPQNGPKWTPEVAKRWRTFLARDYDGSDEKK